MYKRVGNPYWNFDGKRNDAYMNNYIPTTSFWLANSDIQPCTSAHAVVSYIAKYATKGEVDTQSYKDMAKAIVPWVHDKHPLLSYNGKMMNRLIGERDWSAQEVCHILFERPL